ERHITDIRIEPVPQAAFPILKRRRSHRLPLAVLHLLQPNLGLFRKRNTVVRTNNFLEMLRGIRFAGLDYFLGPAFRSEVKNVKMAPSLMSHLSCEPHHRF